MYCKHKPARKEISLASKCKSLCLVYCVMFPINPGALPAGKERGGRQEAFGERSCSEKVPRLRAPGGCRCSGPAPAARELRKELPLLPLHSTRGPGASGCPQCLRYHQHAATCLQVMLSAGHRHLAERSSGDGSGLVGAAWLLAPRRGQQWAWPIRAPRVNRIVGDFTWKRPPDSPQVGLIIYYNCFYGRA